MFQFAACVFLSYILVVAVTLVFFTLFYTDTTEVITIWSSFKITIFCFQGLSANWLLLYAVKNYHTNRNLAEIMDALQENVSNNIFVINNYAIFQLECCGVSSIAQGYRDWNMSYQFNCTTSNPQPEKCGVPFSCCRKSVISEAVCYCLKIWRCHYETKNVIIPRRISDLKIFTESE